MDLPIQLPVFIMRITGIHGLLLAAVLASGCSTSQQVRLAKMSPHPPITSVARAPQDGNSAAMDRHLSDALRDEGLTVRAPLPAGTRSSSEVDAIVSYVDVWRWDMTMYMKSLSIQLYDARTGDLLVTGDWSDSAMHGFRDAKETVRSVVAEMMATLRRAAAPRP